MRRYRYLRLDVFTDRPLTGNGLTVFTDATGLDGTEMQALAREMAQSETTFILPQDPAVEAKSGVRVRIFTVTEELPFAGHPTLGTAAVIAAERKVDDVLLDLDVGPVPVRFQPAVPGAPLTGEMTQRDPVFGDIHERTAVLRALGIPERELSSDAPIQTVSTGLPYVIVPIGTLATLRDMRPDWLRLSDYLERTDGKFFYLVSRQTVDPHNRLHARMVFYGGEDPATGSAAGPCAAWMVRYGLASSNQSFGIEQGLEINRPSRLVVSAGLQGDHVGNIRVGGQVVMVGGGEVVLADTPAR
jgi:trans-2,3-dihydro-3-hydroxyanthranilate isomerase